LSQLSILKSDQNGIEIFQNNKNNKKGSSLKSDQNGIEIFCHPLAMWYFLYLLKSDQNGIEIGSFQF